MRQALTTTVRTSLHNLALNFGLLRRCWNWGRSNVPVLCAVIPHITRRGRWHMCHLPRRL